MIFKVLPNPSHSMILNTVIHLLFPFRQLEKGYPCTGYKPTLSAWNLELSCPTAHQVGVTAVWVCQQRTQSLTWFARFYRWDLLSCQNSSAAKLLLASKLIYLKLYCTMVNDMEVLSHVMPKRVRKMKKVKVPRKMTSFLSCNYLEDLKFFEGAECWF